MQIELTHNDQPVTLELTREAEALRVGMLGGREESIKYRSLQNGLFEIATGNRVFRAAVARFGDEVHVSYEGQLYIFEAPDEERSVGPARKTSGDHSAPMPGIVVDVPVQIGDRVTAYQPLAVVEAMKVMATVESHFAGIVHEVCAVKGQRVAQGEKLVVVVPEETTSE